MTHKENLKIVRDAAILANPEIVTNRHARLTKFDGTSEPIVEMRPITAADVLLALEEKNRGHYAIDARGELLAWGNYYATGGRWQEIGVTLDLHANLSGWSEEAVAALAALLKPND